MCIKSFASVDMMLKHLDFGKHEYQATNSSCMSKIKDQWVKRFTDGDSKSIPGSSTGIVMTDQLSTHHPTLDMGWAIPKRTTRR